MLKNRALARTMAVSALWSLGILLAITADAFAQAGTGVGQLATNVSRQISPIATAAGAISWMAGLGFAISAVMKVKQHSDDPQRHSLKDPLMYGSVAAGLIMIPELLGYGIGSIFGGTATSLNATGVLPTIQSR